jgi:hypothetical protein
MTTSWRRRGLAVSAVAALLLGTGVATLPAVAVTKAPAPQLDGLSFLPAVQSLTSNTHKTLRVSLGAALTIQGGSKFTSMNVMVTRKGVPEMHTWFFDLKNGSLAFNPATGKGSLRAGTQAEPFSKVALSLVATGKKHTVTCGTFKTITQPVKVAGIFTFDTRSTGKGRWGKVGRNVKRTFTGKSDVLYETGLFQTCGGGPPAIPCSATITWSAFHQGAGVNEVSMSGTIRSVHGKSASMLFASRNVAIAKPKNTVRTDTTNLADHRMTFVVSKGKASVHVGASGPFTGSVALISQSAGSAFSIPCGVSKTESVMSWTAPYKNGKSPLTVHEQIEGPIRLPNIPLSSTSPASIDRDTIS